MLLTFVAGEFFHPQLVEIPWGVHTFRWRSSCWRRLKMLRFKNGRHWKSRLIFWWFFWNLSGFIVNLRIYFVKTNHSVRPFWFMLFYFVCKKIPNSHEISRFGVTLDHQDFLKKWNRLTPPPEISQIDTQNDTNWSQRWYIVQSPSLLVSIRYTPWNKQFAPENRPSQ